MFKDTRILYFGYSQIGHDCLKHLLRNGYNVVGLVTHEDSPCENIWFRRPAGIARAYGIPVFTPKSLLDPTWQKRIASLEADLIISAYYRNLLPRPILKTARLGAFNLHGSLLPKFRGRCPINWAIIEGETKSGITLHRMVQKADAGAIVDQESVPIEPDDTAFDLHQKLVPIAVRVLMRNIDDLLSGTASETPQDDSLSSCFGGRRPEDGRIDWSQTAPSIHNLVRALSHPYPGAFAIFGEQRIRIWRTRLHREPISPKAEPGSILSTQPLVIATGDGCLQIEAFEWKTISNRTPAKRFNKRVNC